MGSQAYYGERAFTYVCRVISREVKRGSRLYEIPPVYSINLLNFKMPAFSDASEYFWKIQLKNQNDEVFLPQIKLYFIELCTFARLFKDKELVDDLQRWLYMIANIGTDSLSECPFDGQIFKDFME